MIEVQVTMYDDEKGYINNERFSVVSIDGPRYLVSDGFERHPNAGSLFIVTKEIGQTEARAMEIRDESEKSRLHKLYYTGLETELAKPNKI